MGAQAITRDGKRKRPNVRSKTSAWFSEPALDRAAAAPPYFVRRIAAAVALFSAAHLTIEAIGFAAEEATGVEYAWVHLREYPARVKALLDVYLLDTGPRFLGEPVDTSLVEES